MSARVNCRVDRELDSAIEHFRRRNGLTRSQAIRELLRQALTDADDVTRGWREGYAAGFAEVQQTASTAMAGLNGPASR